MDNLEKRLLLRFTLILFLGAAIGFALGNSGKFHDTTASDDEPVVMSGGAR